MFLRTSALRDVGQFDERCFMYFEDTDLSWRIHRQYRTVFYLHVSVFHDYERRSRKNLRLLGIHRASAVKYFNKWGWFFDRGRIRIKREIVVILKEWGLL